jgi:hypothetical protein
LEGEAWSKDGDPAVIEDTITIEESPNQRIGVENGTDHSGPESAIDPSQQDRESIDGGIRDRSDCKKPGALWLLVSLPGPSRLQTMKEARLVKESGFAN